MEKEEVKTNENEATTEDEYDWKGHIKEVFKDMSVHGELNFFSPCINTEVFYTAIWNMSIKTLGGMEIQVIVDNKDDLYISSGDQSFVSFEGHEDELTNGAPMQIPIKCWIHTHPSGYAYLSSTDWKTTRTWQSIMKSVVVLGDNMYITVDMNNDRFEKNTFQAKKVYYGLLVEDVKTVMDVEAYVQNDYDELEGEDLL